MLDTALHQAAGLATLATHSSPRIVALASHGDRHSELPLLMQLCASWTVLGYPVVVLDATVRESERQPGLLQLLTDGDELSRLSQDPDAWPIVPAALGLAELSRAPAAGTPAATSAARAQQLAELFHSYELILLYAPARELAQALPASPLAPLLPVSTHDAAPLTAYHALKQLLNLGRLRPTIVAVMDDSTLATRVSGHSLGRNLQDCARDFLACEVPALTVCPTQADEMNRLALRTLDNALQPPRCIPPHTATGVAPAVRSY